MKRICHLTSVHPINDVRIFVKECSGLAANGYDVTLIACGNTGFTDVSNGVKRISLNIPVKNRWQRISKRGKAIYHTAVKIDAELYHFHDPELLPVGRRLKKNGKKVIYDAHEDLPKGILAKGWVPIYLRKILSFFAKSVENFYVRHLDGVVTVNNPIRDRFLTVNKKVIICSNFASLREFSDVPDWGNGRNKICYIGGISKIRGIIQVLQAIEKSDIELELAGNISSPKLEQELKKMVGWGKVNYHGVVSRSDLKNIFNSSLAGLVIFLPLQHNRDASPNKIFEYMAAGLPVIASNTPFAEQIILPSRSGICVNPLNPDEIAQAIKFLISNPEKAKEYGRNARIAFEEKYNWEIEEKKLLGLYSTILFQ